MPIPPNPALDETISVGQTGHIADHQVIADTLNDLTGQAVGQQGLESAKPSAATMVAAGNRAGWTWYSTDWKILWRFNGTVWVPISGLLGAKVRRTTDQSLNNATTTQFTGFDTEVWDDQGFHSASGSSLIVPTGCGGKYEVGGSVKYAANATGDRSLDLVHSVGGIVGTIIQDAPVGLDARLSVVAEVDAVAGSSFTMQGYQTSGGALNATATSPYSIVLWCRYIGES